MNRRSFFKTIAAAAALCVIERVPGLAFTVPQVVHGRRPIANAALSYIKQRLSEESFARKILVPMPISRSAT